MNALRRFGVFGLAFLLIANFVPIRAGGRPLGILTVAYGARLNTAEAFVGLSVFDGETVATDEDGKLAVRIGESSLSLAEKSKAVLQKNGSGVHVEMDGGSLSLYSAEANPLAVHVEDAVVQAAGTGLTRARVTVYAPKVLDVHAAQGKLAFSYHGEFRILPEQQTYRIYLEPESDQSAPEGIGSRRTGSPGGTKVAYFIVSGTGTGLAAWGLRDMKESHEGKESEERPEKH